MGADPSFVQSLSTNLVLAAYFNWGLIGLLCIQVYTYYLAFPNDRPITKCLVYIVLILEVVQTSVTSHDIYVGLGSSVGAPDPLTVVNTIYNHWFSIPVAAGITGGIGQLFFAYRIWMMSRGGPPSSNSGQIQTGTSSSRGPPFIICTLAFASLVSALVCASQFFHARTFSILLGSDSDSGSNKSIASIGVWNGIGAICDIVIALTMPYYLMRHGTGLRPTHVVVVKLVRLIIETGILTAIIAILNLCLYLGNSSAFLIPGLALSKVYANTIMVILNNRMEIVAGRHAQEDSSSSSRCRNMLAFRNPQSPAGDTYPQSPGRVRPQRSTIIVSNDRLTIRLNDIPPQKPRPSHLARNTFDTDMESGSASNHSQTNIIDKHLRDSPVMDLKGEGI